MSIAFLFVTCCLEPSRTEVLNLVVDNIKTKMPELLDTITVVDNASTEPGVRDLLGSTFKNVYVVDHNVGYWTAVDWWLTEQQLSQTRNESVMPQFTYIIESDMVHYDFDKIWAAAKFLTNNGDVGSVRLHEYSIENKHLYNKDAPTQGSRSNIWQSHTNKVTGKPVVIDQSRGQFGVYPANFLTQLCALNRYKSMFRVFESLRKIEKFSEVDFQRLYHDHHAQSAILDGGIFNSDPGSYGKKVMTGSWTSPEALAKVGYHGTRQGMILKPSQYTVQKLV